MQTSQNKNFTANNISTALTPDSFRLNIAQLYPWLVVFLGALFLCYKYVLQISPSVMTGHLMDDFQISGSGLGNLAATFFYAFLVTQLIVGPLLDRYSPRWLTTVAILICASGAFIFATTHTLWMAQLARGLMGVGTAFATVSYMKMSTIWFDPKKVAVVDGLLATAAMVGALCAQVPLTFLVDHEGWRSSLIYCGMFGILFSILFLIFVRDHNPQRKITIGPNIQWKDIAAILKNKNNWLLTIFTGMTFTPIASLGGLWGNPFLMAAYNFSSTQSAYFISLVFLGLALGSPLLGYWAGRCGNSIKVMYFGTGLALVSLTMAIYITPLPLPILGFCLFMFGLGTGVFILSFPLGKASNSIYLAGTVVAFINTGDAFLGAVSQPLIGKLLDLVWDGRMMGNVHYFTVHDYQIAFITMPLYLLIGLFCVMFLKKS